MSLFAAHRVAANLLMMLMIIAGVFGLYKLNRQFFPNFALDFVNVRVAWTGAAAEDVESAVVIPLEQALRTLDSLHKMTSTSNEGFGRISLEFKEGTDMGVAVDQVKERVALVRNLPATAEEPEVSRLIRYEPVARLVVTGPGTTDGLRPLIKDIERELLDAGIASIAITGLPDEEIAVQVSSARLRELDLGLQDVAQRIARGSRDLPAGSIGRDEVARQLRALEQRRDEQGFAELALVSDDSGRYLRLGEVATIERRARSAQVEVVHNGKAAVELLALRAETSDSLESAEILQTWLEQRRPELPPGIEITVYDQAWQLIKDRIMLLLFNGGGGLILVVAILFLFLNARVAFWVAIGIPVSFMATLGVMWFAGGSINMISMFGLIMALGIIVDDAIVVGEDALTHFQAGKAPLEAATQGAHRMLAPVMSSSLTTIAAFLPLMLVGGIIGNILFAIPLVVICVILASLVESFLVLPGHLRGSFEATGKNKTWPARAWLNNAFDRFRDGIFRPLVTAAVDHPLTTAVCALSALILAIGLLAGGRVAFNFFPTAESTIVTANISFVAGTPPQISRRFAMRAEAALRQAQSELGDAFVSTAVVRLGQIRVADNLSAVLGDQYATITVELTEPDSREVRNAQIIRRWKALIGSAPGLENLSVFERRAGPPGRDVDVSLKGADAATLKAAALQLAQALSTLEGVSGIEDDLPFGSEQLIYELTPQGRALGLTVEDVGRQLRSAYDGHVAQIFQDGGEEIEVRVVLPDRERFSLASLENFGLRLPSGDTVPLLTAVDISYRRGFEKLRHLDGKLSVRVSADVDPAVTNNDAINGRLRTEVLPGLAQRYGVNYSFEGRAADQAQTLADMVVGLGLGLAMIYLVLAWVFASYGWPLVVMAAIPFGLVGALAGHFVWGIDLTILSLFGFFGLSGIVVNDSIILVTFFKELRTAGMAYRDAIIEAACLRLRAVLLTSLTTIGGLLPLLFETSLQAQFLIPMAISISAGLAFATVLVLLFVPALLFLHEHIRERLALAPGSMRRGGMRSEEFQYFDA